MKLFQVIQFCATGITSGDLVSGIKSKVMNLFQKHWLLINMQILKVIKLKQKI